jgi:ubiquinone/menaquinone biosynthesis C-methylase UbiE
MTEEELELLIDFHKGAERQGPGSSNETMKALSFIPLMNDNTLQIADIGCGTGAQTLTLAQNLNGNLIAVDLFPDFLEKLESHSKELGVDHKIKTLKADMKKLPFQEGEFDVIWAEGSIYLMGFENGIKQWKNFLKPGGYLAVSEITWITDIRPKEIEKHWSNEYPEIDTASSKIKLLEENGYSPVGYFALPESCWLDNYYDPMKSRFDSFLERHSHSESARGLVELEKAEIEMYKKYKNYISYGFYIAKKV